MNDQREHVAVGHYRSGQKSPKTKIALYKCNCKRGQESTSIKMVERVGRKFPKCDYCHCYTGITTTIIEV